jgi:hypothetical protein
MSWRVYCPLGLPEGWFLVHFIASRRGPFQWIGVLKSAGWVSIHKSRGHEFLRRTVWEKNLLQDEIAPPWKTSERWCRFNQRNVEYLVATTCPDTPQCVSIEYWWSFVPYVLRSRALCFVATVYLWRMKRWCTESEVLIGHTGPLVIVRVARGWQFDATTRRKFDDYTTINEATTW